MRAVWVAGVRWLFSDAAADAFYCAVRWALLVFLAGALLLLGFLIPWRLAHAQTSGFAVSDVVCGPAGIAGVVYISVGGTAANCGSDSQGNQLVLQVSTLSPDQPVDGGVETGLQIGGAVLAVLAVAWCFRVVRNHLDSSGEA